MTSATCVICIVKISRVHRHSGGRACPQLHFDPARVQRIASRKLVNRAITGAIVSDKRIDSAIHRIHDRWVQMQIHGIARGPGSLTVGASRCRPQDSSRDRSANGAACRGHANGLNSRAAVVRNLKRSGNEHVSRRRIENRAAHWRRGRMDRPDRSRGRNRFRRRSVKHPGELMQESRAVPDIHGVRTGREIVKGR